MKSLELFDISAKLSREITEWSPLYNKVTKVVNQNTFELTHSETAVSPSNFWEDDRRDRVLKADQKSKIFLQYHRSKDIYGNVLAFVSALKELCDSGVPLYHNGIPVVDLWVLSTAELDVSDVFDSKVIWLTDSISGYTFPSVSTYENMDTLRNLGSDVCQNIGLVPPEPDNVEENLKLHRPEAYRGTMPHLWVAAIIEDDRIEGRMGRSMVHVDICAAAFEEDGMQKYDGSFVSLKMFSTPEYDLVASKNLERAVRKPVFSRQRLILRPCVRPTEGQWQLPMLNFMPFEIRHLRCFDRIDGSYIEMTPIDCFVGRNNHLLPGDADSWTNFVTKLRHEIMSEVPLGARIFITNLQKRPELNGETGRVHKVFPNVTSRQAKKRVYVWVPSIPYPIGLTTGCFVLTKSRKYSCLEDFVRRAEERRSDFSTEDDEMRTISSNTKAAFEAALKGDTDLRLAVEVLIAGKLTVYCFTDSSFVRGVRKLVSAPFNTVLSTKYRGKLRSGLEVADHPQAGEAFKILRLVKVSKLKVLEKEPSFLRSDGSMNLNESSDFHKLMRRVGEKIRSDGGLTMVFRLMDEQGLFSCSAWV